MPNPPDRRPLRYIAAGVGLAVVLLVVMFMVDRSSDTGPALPKRNVDLDSITIPGSPTADEVARAAAGA